MVEAIPGIPWAYMEYTFNMIIANIQYELQTFWPLSVGQNNTVQIENRYRVQKSWSLASYKQL